MAGKGGILAFKFLGGRPFITNVMATFEIHLTKDHMGLEISNRYASYSFHLILANFYENIYTITVVANLQFWTF